MSDDQTVVLCLRTAECVVGKLAHVEDEIVRHVARANVGHLYAIDVADVEQLRYSFEHIVQLVQLILLLEDKRTDDKCLNAYDTSRILCRIGIACG